MMPSATLTVDIFREESDATTRQSGVESADEPEPSDSLLTHWANLAFAIEPANSELTRSLSAHNNNSASISIALVETDHIQTLNKDFRGLDKPTNVLSFATDYCDLQPDSSKNLPLPLGDIVLCSNIICEEATQQEKSRSDHWAHMVVHGVLHLLGYDHENDADAERMEAIEIKLLAQIGIENPYIQEAQSQI